MFLNVAKNAKTVIASELSANVHFLALMNVSSRNWSPFYANECLFSRNEQQKVEQVDALETERTEENHTTKKQNLT